MNKFIFMFINLFITAIHSQAQSGYFDVFTYKPTAFFTKKELPSRLQFTMKNDDTSNCTITLFKSITAKNEVKKDITSQWNELVVKRLTKVEKNRQKSCPDNFWMVGNLHWPLKIFIKTKKMRGDALFIQ